MKLYQIISTDPTKQCDFFPAHSIHEDRSKIHYFCEVRQVPSNTLIKSCSCCGLAYPQDYVFVKSNQMNTGDMCIRCWGKNYVINHGNYYEAVRAEVLMELKNKKL